MGWVGDRVPLRHLLRLGATLFVLLAYPFYATLEARTMNLTLVLALAGLCGGLTNGSFAVLLTDLFPTRIRFSGVALVFNIAFTVFSGMSPLVATTLIRDTGAATAPWLLLAAGAGIALVGSIRVGHYGGNVLTPPT